MTPNILHVEVVQKNDSLLNEATLQNYVLEGFRRLTSVKSGCTVAGLGDPLLADHVEAIHICNLAGEYDSRDVLLVDCAVHIHIYKLESIGAQIEGMTADENGEELSAASHWVLPTREFQGLWENLIFTSEIKENLLQFVQTTVLFSDKAVSPQVISWNRVVLLHGPPGTGKTSLCKALAQKLAIRLSSRYSHGQLLEINSHSLFSKWFSESGKLVMKMFSKIEEMVENPNALVCVLIDEVESLTHARQCAIKGTEPSDSIRTVNAVLTQIDNLKRYPNVLILATSNVTGAIDLAFVDRADIKQYIGPPCVEGIYRILWSCIQELQKASIICPTDEVCPLNTLKSEESRGDSALANAQSLLSIARLCEGMSGRTLRKLPFLAHALFIQKPSVSLAEYLSGLHKAVDKYKLDTQDLLNEKKS